MRKFEDCWVVDRTMFEYVNQGGCSCCGVTHQIMDVAQLADRCSDWESDDEKKEQFSPWPTFIHEEILTERARLRVVMKEDMRQYKAFIDTHMKGFSAWWQQLDESTKNRVFQVPDEDVMDYFKSHAKVKGSYEIVLCAVMEQLRHFNETGYKDGRIPPECCAEQYLQNRRSCFVMDPKYVASADGAVNFCEIMQILGGPKLLPLRLTRDPAQNNQAEQEVAQSVANVQSFRSDRRLLRLVIFRKFADVAMRKYLREGTDSKEKAAVDDEDGNQATAD
ncbi:hypothetical protein Poli38472_000937 [Pythium oligandrum]|uniref:Uncharacterized protein n=1 Tax=Pythium oligandrum TaxID=41045 RepID=A0A8K1CD15_PYTOL|nr:hypothetical protein Poli38472_000937 [Pythium oligandrum]|eukprot:TMW60895.1 hypothetical protein Poli38472_000937 [Pythium oligandrum]